MGLADRWWESEIFSRQAKCSIYHTDFAAVEKMTSYRMAQMPRRMRG